MGLSYLLVCVTPVAWGWSGVLVRWAGLPGKEYVIIGPATFIIYIAPVFVALLAPPVLKEKLERSTVLCLAIAMGGTALQTRAFGGGR